MIDTPFLTESQALVVKVGHTLRLSDEEFFQLCQENPELRLERTAQGDIVVMSPAGWESSNRNAPLTALLYLWASQDGTGEITDSSGGYKLPNGAILWPDAAWVRNERLAQIPAEQRRKFLPLCPDFVVELRSPTDSIRELQTKMEEYIANGALLGWLLIPETREVYIYQPDTPVGHLQDPTSLSGDPLLPGFVLPLNMIWNAGA